MKYLKQISILVVCLLYTLIYCIYNLEISNDVKPEIEIKNEPTSSQTDTVTETLMVNKKRNINEKIKKILEKYSKLNKIIIEADIKIPNEKNFIPQGIALVKDNILITGYYDSKKKSKCYVINNLGEVINVVELDINSHVGSISYDEINDLIWIPDNNGALKVYKRIDFFEKTKVKAIYRFNNISDGLTDFQNPKKNLIAYSYVYQSYLYIGNFFIDKECTIKKYKITFNDNKLTLQYINTFKTPSRTQSIMFIENNNKTYMLLSKSYRRRNPSYLYVYEYNENIKKYTNKELIKIKTPPMLEQINSNNNYLYFLFESNATKYKNCPEKIGFILVGDIDEIFNNINNTT